MRALGTAVLCAVAVFAGDAVFRASLLHQLRPVILSPADDAVLAPPVQVQWDGPHRMRVLLSTSGGEPRDLGIHEAPFDLGGEAFPRDGGYQIELRAPRLGGWIRTTRWFQVHAPETAPVAQDGQPTRGMDVEDLLHALDAVRHARDKAHERTKFLRDENAALRDESERLAKQLEGLYKTQEDDAARTAELERRLTQLAEEHRAVADENAALRQRLGSVIPCTVWGYYSFPRPQTIPVTRRILMVSDTRGQVFRRQADCELLRRADPDAASICFCAGNSFAG